MGRNIYKPEQIITKLGEVEVLLSKEPNVPNIVRHMGITEQTYYRWKKA